MFESSGQLPPGLFGAGNYHADGLFDECQAVRSPIFNGQYCSVYFKPEIVDQSKIIPAPPSSYKEQQEGRSNFITIFQILGILGQISGAGRVEPKLAGINSATYVLPSVSFCIPSSCTAGDLSSAVAHRLHHQFNHFSLASVTSEDFCYTKDKIRSDSQFGIGGIITSYA